MKYYPLHTLIISMLLLVACASDEEERALHTEVLTLPITVCTPTATPLSSPAVRSTGDPGIWEPLPAPQYLYVWMVKGDEVILHTKYENIATNWQKHTDDPARWDCNLHIELSSGIALNNADVIQFFFIASRHALDDAWLTDLTTRSLLEDLTLDLSTWQNASAADHSWALGNLYSTPLALMADGNSDATAAGIIGSDDRLHNGTYTVNKVGRDISLANPRPTRLYHCAAKADFKWEVANALQPAVSVSTITLNGLPTQLKVFEPTHNPDSPTGSCPLLAASNAVNTLTPGNKWLGREYAYVLQPPTTTSDSDGKISYDVTFTGGHTTVSDQTTSPATNPVFTTWYRINADIQD